MGGADDKVQPEQLHQDDPAVPPSDRVVVASDGPTTTARATTNTYEGDQKNEAAKGGNQARKPTLKQQKFAAAMIETNGNRTAAAELAGYRGNRNVLAGVGHANARNPIVQHRIAQLLEPMVARAVQCVGEALDATTCRSFLSREGNIVSTDPVPDHKTRMHAAKIVLDRGDQNSSVLAPSGDQANDDIGAEELLEQDDRVLLEEVAVIDKELAELDSVNGDHVDGQR